jgi:hypothetical protein
MNDDFSFPSIPPDPPLKVALMGRPLKGRDVWVIGTGPSLKGFDLGRMAGRSTIALNDAGLWMQASIWLFNDVDLWKRYLGSPPADRRTLVVCQGEAADHLMVKGWRNVWVYDKWRDVRQCPVEDDSLFCRTTVATAGVHLAWKLGARRIFLMGVDGYKEPGLYYADGSPPTKIDPALTRTVGKEPDGRVIEARHEEFRRDMRDLRRWFEAGARIRLEPWPGAGVFNLSPRSWIDAWEKVDLEEALASGAPSVASARR